MRDLKARNVEFEHYDMPETKRQGDVHVSGSIKNAWFKDPDGNILGIMSGMNLDRAKQSEPATGAEIEPVRDAGKAIVIPRSASDEGPGAAGVDAGSARPRCARRDIGRR